MRPTRAAGNSDIMNERPLQMIPVLYTIMMMSRSVKFVSGAVSTYQMIETHVNHVNARRR